MKTRVVYQARLVLIACLIAFGLSGISHAQKNGHPPWVWSVAYSPDGGTLASGSTDETIRLWDIATGEVLATLSGHTDWVCGVTYSPNGRTLASGGGDNKVRLWDVSTGDLLVTLTGHADEDPDSAGVWSVTYSPDGSTLASGGSDDKVRLWDAATGGLLATLSGHTKAVTSVAYAPAGGTLASGGYDNNGVRFWDIASYIGGEPTAVAETSWGQVKVLLSVP